MFANPSEQYFYPRSPCGERRHGRTYKRSKPQHFYPRSPCGERPLLSRNTLFDTAISIHALLAESDQWRPEPLRPGLHFYPRSPCGERLISRFSCAVPFAFLSTLSLRRATASRFHLRATFSISIHALLAESDRERSK